MGKKLPTSVLVICLTVAAGFVSLHTIGEEREIVCLYFVLVHVRFVIVFHFVFILGI